MANHKLHNLISCLLDCLNRFGVYKIGKSFVGFSFAILIVSFSGILYMKTLNDITKER